MRDMKIYKFITKIANIVCAIALFCAVHSINNMCLGRWHQPEVPKGLGKYRNI